MPFVKYSILLFLLFSTSFVLYAQDVVEEQEETIDSLYREDQFYFGINYNLLVNKPAEMSQRGFSGGLQLGYLRDMPINAKRNIALALGAGLKIDTYGHTLFMGEEANNQSVFITLGDDFTFDRNRFTSYIAEIPFEFRWRSSTAKSYKFWRIYTGLRVGYAFFYKAKFKQTGNEITQTSIDEFNRLRLSATLSFGYNTFNFFASYGLNPFFDNATTTQGDAIEIRALRVGLIFYIL